MRYLDKAIQRARIRRAIARIGHGGHILDVGCHQGELRDALDGRSCTYIGIDPDVTSPSEDIVRGHFPDDVPATWENGSFDHVVALAVLEHIKVDELGSLFAEVRRLLTPEGTLIATVPSPFTDRILDVLVKLRLIDGMDLDAHDGLSIDQLKAAATEAGLELTEHRHFQLRLNNVLVWTSGNA